MSTHVDELDLTGPTPQDYGFPANPSTVNRQCWDRQQAFLLAYSQLGTIRHAAEAVGIHRDTVNKWISADLYSFKKRMELAHDDYCDWIQEGNRGSDVLVMFAAKAEMPEKYREEVKVLNVDAPFQMLERLKEMAGRERRQRELEAPAIEGAFRDISTPGQESPTQPPPQSEAGGASGVSSRSPEAMPRDVNHTPQGQASDKGKPLRKVFRR
jgi:hypothetical protein